MCDCRLVNKLYLLTEKFRASEYRNVYTDEEMAYDWALTIMSQFLMKDSELIPEYSSIIGSKKRLRFIIDKYREIVDEKYHEYIVDVFELDIERNNLRNCRYY